MGVRKIKLKYDFQKIKLNKIEKEKEDKVAQ